MVSLTVLPTSLTVVAASSTTLSIFWPSLLKNPSGFSSLPVSQESFGVGAGAHSFLAGAISAWGLVAGSVGSTGTVGVADWVLVVEVILVIAASAFGGLVSGPENFW